MTSQITSHIEYLLLTDNVLVLISYSKLTKNLASLTVLIRYWWWWLTFLGHPV